MLQHPYWLSAIGIVFALLLVLPIKLMALKFTTFQWATNELRFACIGLSLAMAIVLGMSAVPFSIVLYIVFSLIFRDKIG